MVSDDPAFSEWLAAILAADAGLSFLPALPYGIEVSIRDLETGPSAVFVLNWNGFSVNVTVGAAAGGVDALTGKDIGAQGLVEMEPYGVAVIAVPSA
jgi:hypothetical protein